MSKFLSTLSLRRATRFFDVSLNYFYPRSPCGERLNKRCEFNGDNRFLSTLSLRRATVSVWCFCGGAFGFLSTLSLRRATADAPQDGPQLGFLSTLSLRRATNLKNTASRCRGYFYPRSPCGERRLSYFYIIKITQFLSTLSLRRATQQDGHQHAGYPISIHALLAESDANIGGCASIRPYFYPRSPCGERLSIIGKLCPVLHFYPRSPCGERPGRQTAERVPSGISIHALLAESDRLSCTAKPAKD